MKNFIGKLFIVGEIKLLTGLSIGCGGQSGIGLIDSPVIRDPKTDKPYIPGSSLKGRLRHAVITINGGNDKHENVLNLFGQSPNNENKSELCVSRVFVRDSRCLTNKPSLEIKYENVIDHVTGTTRSGGLRQIERVAPGTIFDLELVYNADEIRQAKNDLNNLHKALEFVEDEYLGGSGSRGYGKVKFQIKNLKWKSKEYYLGKNKDEDCKIELTDSWIAKAMELVTKNAKVPS